MSVLHPPCCISHSSAMRALTLATPAAHISQTLFSSKTKNPFLIPFPLSFFTSPIIVSPLFSPPLMKPLSRCNLQSSDENHQALVQDLRVPHHWLHPSKALQESEWLRVSLHKWLDDEYCPEPTNIIISKIAAESYYESLIGKQADLGEILLKMVKDLESISYQESFHGAFSSANAAVNLIVLRIESDATL